MGMDNWLRLNACMLAPAPPYPDSGPWSTQGWRGLCPEWSSTASGGHIYVMINGYSISLYDETLHGTKEMSATDATYVLSKH